MVAREDISKGQYVCEYRTYRVYPVGSEEAAKLVQEYTQGSYVLSTAHTVPGAGTRLSFESYRDLGRLINHTPRGFNLTPGSPVHVRGKWRVGMVAVRDIEEGEELTYDYSVRSEHWMKAGKKARSGEQDVPARDSGSVGGAMGESREGSPAVHVVGISRESGKKVYKPNFFWCPEQDCASRPIQKVTQHLQKVHKMDLATAAMVARKKRRAPANTVRPKMPKPQHPVKQSATYCPVCRPHINSLPTCSSHIISHPTCSSMHPRYLKTGLSLSLHPQHVTHWLPPRRFVLGWLIRTRAGGNRGEHSARQITRYVGKDLFHLNPELLDTDSVSPQTQRAGIGSSGILHRILAHKAAVNFMCLGVSYLWCGVKLCTSPLCLPMVEDSLLRKADRLMW